MESAAKIEAESPSAKEEYNQLFERYVLYRGDSDVLDFYSTDDIDSSCLALLPISSYKVDKLNMFVTSPNTLLFDGLINLEYINDNILRDLIELDNATCYNGLLQRKLKSIFKMSRRVLNSVKCFDDYKKFIYDYINLIQIISHTDIKESMIRTIIGDGKRSFVHVVDLLLFACENISAITKDSLEKICALSNEDILRLNKLKIRQEINLSKYIINNISIGVDSIIESVNYPFEFDISKGDINKKSKIYGDYNNKATNKCIDHILPHLYSYQHHEISAISKKVHTHRHLFEMNNIVYEDRFDFDILIKLIDWYIITKVNIAPKISVNTTQKHMKYVSIIVRRGYAHLLDDIMSTTDKHISKRTIIICDAISDRFSEKQIRYLLSFDVQPDILQKVVECIHHNIQVDKVLHPKANIMQVLMQLYKLHEIDIRDYIEEYHSIRSVKLIARYIVNRGSVNHYNKIVALAYGENLRFCQLLTAYMSKCTGPEMVKIELTSREKNELALFKDRSKKFKKLNLSNIYTGTKNDNPMD